MKLRGLASGDGVQQRNYGMDVTAIPRDRETMKTLPAAVVELLLRFFGEAGVPDFGGARACELRDAYGSVRSRLATTWDVEDLTDFQCDLGWSWWLSCGTEVINVRLSFVGPYAVLLDSAQTAVIDHRELRSVLESEGFSLLGVDTLRIPVQIWAPECEGPLYEFLFEFDRGSPWQR